MSDIYEIRIIGLGAILSIVFLGLMASSTTWYGNVANAIIVGALLYLMIIGIKPKRDKGDWL